jgi:hypothetical protein
MMFLQEAFYISLYLFAASIAVAPSPNPDFGDSHLPSLRISREEVQAMKESQTYPPGYIHKYVTLGEGISVPIVEADPNILLGDEDGVRARSLAPCSSCLSIPNGSGNCNINYCWTGTDGNTYAEAITITGSNGKSNPTSVTSSNISNLYLSSTANTGYNHWFPTGHECSNDDTQMYTDHRLDPNGGGQSHVSQLQCDTCEFNGFVCRSSYLLNNLVAFAGGSAAQVNCTQS